MRTVVAALLSAAAYLSGKVGLVEAEDRRGSGINSSLRLSLPVVGVVRVRALRKGESA
jgi:hypothetical protein